MQRLVPEFAPVKCCDNFRDSFGDLKNWYVHELLRTVCLVNVGVKDHFINRFSTSSELLRLMGLHFPALAHMSLKSAKWSITIDKSVFDLCRWSTLRWIKSQIWTLLTAAREMWVLDVCAGSEMAQPISISP